MAAGVERVTGLRRDRDLVTRILENVERVRGAQTFACQGCDIGCIQAHRDMRADRCEIEHFDIGDNRVEIRIRQREIAAVCRKAHCIQTGAAID